MTNTQFVLIVAIAALFFFSGRLPALANRVGRKVKAAADKAKAAAKAEG